MYIHYNNRDRKINPLSVSTSRQAGYIVAQPPSG